MDKQQALELTKKIRQARKDLTDLVIQAFDGKAWIPLGYDSWDDYCAAEFESDYLRLPKEERIQAVTRRKQAGMSNRAIASSLGVHESTVRDDLKSNAGNPAMPEQVTTTDGRSYPAKRDNPAPKEQRNKVIDENVAEAESRMLDEGRIPPKIELSEQKSTLLDGDAITEEVARRDAILSFRDLVFGASEKLSEITDFGLLGIPDEVEWMKSAIDELSNMWAKAQGSLVESYQK
jgi:transposase-like protein